MAPWLVLAPLVSAQVAGAWHVWLTKTAPRKKLKVAGKVRRLLMESRENKELELMIGGK